ncbi:hypothetical protein D4764_02G0002620 [Takifugu flavidus]|uniref:HTH CENPB-type domain-containing protein n=1 Tax=Takifugu flavidus TaxID=433684 RepID=A0A5C6NKP4_9TELE|nr:hypothetical protein D4764_02G0002620 [Takifugu flavidus]
MSPWSESGENKEVGKTKLSFCGNKARWPKLENRVEQLVVEQRTTGRGISTVTIRQKAKAIAEEMDIEHFQGGPCWCFRFMRRQHLSICTRTTVVLPLPADYQERVAIFRTYCRDKITAPTLCVGALDDERRTLLHKDYEAAAGKLCYHMRVVCRRMGYDTVFM